MPAPGSTRRGGCSRIWRWGSPGGRGACRLFRGLAARLGGPGRVFADMAVAIADGADCVSHIEVFGDQHGVCGPVASMPTTWRLVDRIDPAHLPGVRAARAAARERAWSAGAAPDLTGLLHID